MNLFLSWYLEFAKWRQAAAEKEENRILALLREGKHLNREERMCWSLISRIYEKRVQFWKSRVEGLQRLLA